MRTLIFFVLTITSACNNDPISDACQRADECNALNGSVQECVDYYSHLRDSLPQTYQEEVDKEVQDCLDHPACGVFVSCVNAIFATDP